MERSVINYWEWRGAGFNMFSGSASRRQIKETSTQKDISQLNGSSVRKHQRGLYSVCKTVAVEPDFKRQH